MHDGVHACMHDVGRGQTTPADPGADLAGVVEVVAWSGLVGG